MLCLYILLDFLFFYLSYLHLFDLVEFFLLLLDSFSIAFKLSSI